MVHGLHVPVFHGMNLNSIRMSTSNNLFSETPIYTGIYVAKLILYLQDLSSLRSDQT